VSVVSVSLPPALVEDIDRVIQSRAFAGRSELVRAALREFLAANPAHADSDAQRTATLTLVYPKGQERRIGEIRHDYGDVLRSMMHSDVAESCTEVFMLQGPSRRIDEFVDRLKAHRDVRLAKAVYTDP
jgi:CopG family transcriptional regulator, nickel-responsive regulator